VTRFRAVQNTGLVRLLVGFLAPAVLFLVFRRRDCIAAGEPAVQVDVGAALRAERPYSFVCGLAADRARLAGFVVGHDQNWEMIGIWGAQWAAPTSHCIQPAEMDRIAFAAEQRRRLVERQADDVGIGTDDFDQETAGDALRRVAAGLAAPFS